jgi:hypothetical protein
MRDGEIVSSLAISDTLNRVPVVSIDYVFADRSVISSAKAWLDGNRATLIQPKKEKDANGET